MNFTILYQSNFLHSGSVAQFPEISDFYDRKIIVYSTFELLFSIITILYLDKCIYLKLIAKHGSIFFFLFLFAASHVFANFSSHERLHIKDKFVAAGADFICFWIRCNKCPFVLSLWIWLV